MLFRPNVKGIVLLAALLAACGSTERRTTIARPAATAAASAPTASASASASAREPPKRGRDVRQPDYRGLFSDDGRYIVLDAVIDLEDVHQRRLPLACDLASVRWLGASRVWCVSPTRDELRSLDVATGATTAVPFSGDNDIFVDPSDRFIGWGNAEGTTDLFDTQTGASQHLPSSAYAYQFHGPVVRIELLFARKIVLWDASRGESVGAPYLSDGVLNALPSDDDRWSFDFNRVEGQLVVELATGQRRVVGTPRETTYGSTAIAILEPFSHDSTRVAAAATPAGVRIMEMATGHIDATLVAPGCETPMNVRWSKSGDLLVVGDHSGLVCAYDMRTHALRWSTQLPPSRRSPPLGKSGELGEVAHTGVSELDFTVDEQGIVAGVVSAIADNEAVLLRTSDGSILKTLGTSVQVSSDANGNLFAGGFLVGAKLKTTPLPSGWTPAARSLEYFADLPATRCESSSFAAVGCAPWRNVTVIDRDPKSRWVVGRAADYIGVWSAANGDLVYTTPLPPSPK